MLSGRNNQRHSIEGSLQSAILKAFRELGGASSNALMWYLTTKGYVITDKVDFEKLYGGTQAILGEGANIVMKAILQNLCDDFGYVMKPTSNEVSMIEQLNAVLLRADEENRAGE